LGELPVSRQQLRDGSIPVLSSPFRRVAISVDGGFISAKELAEFLDDDNRANLFVGVFVNNATQTITFWRGNLESLTIPYSAFEKWQVGRSRTLTLCP
jgi:hypothetical protein